MANLFVVDSRAALQLNTCEVPAHLEVSTTGFFDSAHGVAAIMALRTCQWDDSLAQPIEASLGQLTWHGPSPHGWTNSWRSQGLGAVSYCAVGAVSARLKQLKREACLIPRFSVAPLKSRLFGLNRVPLLCEPGSLGAARVSRGTCQGLGWGWS